MRLIGIAATLAFALTSVSATAQVHVRGYVKKDGTYVPPHTRSAPNSTRNDNWSTAPNINPYTGEQGKKQPSYQPPTYQMPTYQPPVYQPYKAPCYYNCKKD